jgi:hypothetical protein
VRTRSNSRPQKKRRSRGTTKQIDLRHSPVKRRELYKTNRCCEWVISRIESELIFVAADADASISTSFLMVAFSSLERHPQFAASTRMTRVENVVKNDGSNKNDADNNIRTGMLE